MTERELFKKLNNLKEIKPDQKWKSGYREILYSQISSSRPSLASKSNLKVVWESIMPGQILINLAKPVWQTLIASILILIIGIGGVYASKNSKPGDSLYIAKIISEKAQLAMALNEKDKARLGVEFASNRAKEMIQVLNDSKETAKSNDEKLNVLSQNFKKEISQVKKSLTVIKAAKDQAKKEAVKNEDSQVFGANLGKNNQRMEIAEQPTANIETEPKRPVSLLEGQPALNSTSTSTAENINQTDQMLEQAEKLFDEKNLDGTIGLLEQVSKVIDKEGEVKGASETATSTE